MDLQFMYLDSQRGYHRVVLQQGFMDLLSI